MAAARSSGEVVSFFADGKWLRRNYYQLRRPPNRNRRKNQIELAMNALAK
jgi:hypothetical protein